MVVTPPEMIHAMNTIVLNCLLIVPTSILTAMIRVPDCSSEVQVGDYGGIEHANT